MPQDYYAPPKTEAPANDFPARIDQPVELVGRALNLFFANWLVYGGLGLLVLGPVSALAQWYAQANPVAAGEANWGQLRINIMGAGLVAPLAVAGVLSTLGAHRQGQPAPTLGEALGRGFALWRPVFAARFVSGLKIGVGLLLFVVPGVYFGLQLALVDEAVVFGGDRTASTAMARSETWTKGQLRQVFLVTFAAGMAAMVPGLALGIVGGATDMQPLVWAGAALDCALSPILTIAGALMYWDVARSRDAEPQA